MIEDKELIRRALLGDPEAQKQCTEAGIVLPCPICRGKIEQSITGNRFICKQCGFVFYAPISGNYGADEYINIVHRFNTRPAPLVGRCKDCLWYLPTSKRCKYSLGGLWGEVNELSFCSCFNPKED